MSLNLNSFNLHNALQGSNTRPKAIQPKTPNSTTIKEIGFKVIPPTPLPSPSLSSRSVTPPPSDPSHSSNVSDCGSSSFDEKHFLDPFTNLIDIKEYNPMDSAPELVKKWEKRDAEAAKAARDAKPLFEEDDSENGILARLDKGAEKHQTTTGWVVFEDQRHWFKTSPTSIPATKDPLDNAVNYDDILASFDPLRKTPVPSPFEERNENNPITTGDLLGIDELKLPTNRHETTEKKLSFFERAKAKVKRVAMSCFVKLNFNSARGVL